MDLGSFRAGMGSGQLSSMGMRGLGREPAGVGARVLSLDSIVTDEKIGIFSPNLLGSHCWLEYHFIDCLPNLSVEKGI